MQSQIMRRGRGAGRRHDNPRGGGGRRGGRAQPVGALDRRRAGYAVVASLPSGRETIAWFDKGDADIVLLDIEMPDLDGISALPLLLQKKRDLVVIMVSTFTRRSAEISLRALSLGAADYIPKPESTREVTTSISFRRELLEKIRALGHRRRLRRGCSAAAGAALGA